MKTFRELDVYPRILLIVMLVMLLAFSIAYPLTISRVGYQYRGTVLVPQVQENQTVYSGKVNGQKAAFTVTSDGIITYQWGDTTYGPYTLREDPSALPSNAGTGAQAKGVELYKGEKLLFRCCGLRSACGDHFLCGRYVPFADVHARSGCGERGAIRMGAVVQKGWLDSGPFAGVSPVLERNSIVKNRMAFFVPYGFYITVLQAPH